MQRHSQITLYYTKKRKNSYKHSQMSLYYIKKEKQLQTSTDDFVLNKQPWNVTKTHSEMTSYKINKQELLQTDTQRQLTM